jgi:hypothetical protein
MAPEARKKDGIKTVSRNVVFMDGGGYGYFSGVKWL